MNRREAIAHIHDHFLTTGYPRAVILAILTLAGGAAFLFSAAALTAGIERMALRYPLAVLVGYAAFLALIRMWIAWKRDELHGDFIDVLPEVPLPLPQAEDSHPGSVLFAEGRSGGGGGGATWNSPVARTSRAPELPEALDVDAGEIWPVIVVAVGALAGAIAVAYTVYIAPVLLAEVALDAAVVTTLYRRLRTGDEPHWAMSVIRRTWIPAACLAMFMMLAGFGLQQLVPSARSIGGVLRGL